jgi:Tfp pilus assembly protein PilE
MWDSLAERSIAFIILSNWIPPLITIVIGGIFASILLPLWQHKYTQSKALAARRLEIAENVTKNFQKYIVSWKRLMTISALEQEAGLNDEQRQTKMSFVAVRNANRDALLESLALTKIYFPASCAAVVGSFLKWDEDRSTERLDQLPGITVWREWEQRVLQSLHQELMK